MDFYLLILLLYDKPPKNSVVWTINRLFLCVQIHALGRAQQWWLVSVGSGHSGQLDRSWRTHSQDSSRTWLAAWVAWRPELDCSAVRQGPPCLSTWAAGLPHKMVAQCQRPVFQEAGNECDQPLKDCAWTLTQCHFCHALLSGVTEPAQIQGVGHRSCLWTGWPAKILQWSLIGYDHRGRDLPPSFLPHSRFFKHFSLEMYLRIPTTLPSSTLQTFSYGYEIKCPARLGWHPTTLPQISNPKATFLMICGLIPSWRALQHPFITYSYVSTNPILFSPFGVRRLYFDIF